MKYIIILIFILGFILRFFTLGEVPVSLHRDEVFFGYNAYSILKTGRDISGEFLPLHLESFFMSPAGYSYAVLSPIALFGLNDFAVRFPSALFGSLSIIVLYFLSLKFFSGSNNKYIVAAVASFLFAISPWHINLSRVATENVLVLFFILLGILFYLEFVKSKKTLVLIISFISFSLTLLLYQAPRAFLPLFIPALLFFSQRNFKSLLRIKIEYLLFFALIVFPVVLILLSPDLSWRLSSLSVFNHSETNLVINEQLTVDSVQGIPYFISRLFHNKLIGFSFLISENFFKHLSFDFLFLDYGYPDRYRIPQMGLLYFFELPFLIAGLFFGFIKKRKLFILLTIWIIAGIFGSALTSDDVPNVQRTLIILPAFCIIAAFGFTQTSLWIKGKTKILYPLLIFLVVIILINVSYFFLQYFVQGKVYNSVFRQDGYEEMVSEVNKLLPNYDYALITNKESTPAIFFMYFNKYDPSILQEETKDYDMRGAGDVPFYKYKFSTDECPVRYELDENNNEVLVGEPGILYVMSGECKEIPEEANTLKEIKRVGGSTAFLILDIRK